MEEWRFTPVRIAIFVALLVAFGLWGGFLPPEVNGAGSPRNVTRAWLLLLVLFVGGSACATMGDQTYGTMDRSSLRFLYLVGGMGAIVISVFWLNSLRQLHEGPERKEEVRFLKEGPSLAITFEGL